MNIKGFKAKDGTVYKYDYDALANKPAIPEGPGSGGNADQTSVEPADNDIPMVFLTGDEFGNMTNEKNEVKMVMDYISKTDSFRSPIKIKYQGSSSLSYAKKNFTIKMYEDDTYDGKLKKAFRDWGVRTNKYVLKANFIDHSHARNIVGANLWSQIVASRPDYATLPEEMRNSPRNGAIDGFPIKVYVNGTYQGLYTWNIGKDDWMWGMDEDNPNHVLMCAETNDNGKKIATPCNFRALWNGVNETHWSVEVGTNSTALKNSLNNLIQFVMDNDGDDFRNGIGNYLDIQSAIDYYLYQYAICGHDALGKNLLLATYDGTKWICGSYDMDGTFGLYQDGKKFLPANYACPEQYQETNSLLWERIEANYVNELKARYAELRNSVLSISNMFATFEHFTNRISSDLYMEDLTIYTAIPLGTTNNIKQIRNYIRDRLAYVDGEIAAMSLPVPCEGIVLDKSTLAFTAEGTQTVTATLIPDGCTDSVVWVCSDPSVATISVNGYVCTVEATANGNATITATCGEYSASCTVAVSGIAEPVPCTGITLDKSTLTFTGNGAQTITATVTPSDTTDRVTWSSDNPSVATVENGVVTAVYNGSATITATCGSQSASCVVSVSGVEAALLYSLPQETVFDGTSYIDTGVKLFDAPKDFTILLTADLTRVNETAYAAIVFAKQEGVNKSGLYVYAKTDGTYNIGGYEGVDYKAFENSYVKGLTHHVKKIAISVTQGVVTGVSCASVDGCIEATLPTAHAFQATEQVLLLGAYQDENGAIGRYWNGVIHDFKVYDGVLADEAIDSYMVVPEPDASVARFQSMDGTVTTMNGGTMTIENGNHLHWDKIFGNGCFANITNIFLNTNASVGLKNHLTNKPEIFKLHSGDIIRTVVTVGDANTNPAEMTLFGVSANATDTLVDFWGTNSSVNGEQTVTCTKDGAIGAVGFYVAKTPACIVDITVEMYVNGVRYI